MRTNRLAHSRAGARLKRATRSASWTSGAARLCVAVVALLMVPASLAALTAYVPSTHLGQPDFTSGAFNRTITPQASGMSGAGDVAVDPVRHRLFVSDPGNGRVLVFVLDEQNHRASHAASYVLGKSDMSTPATAQMPSSSNMASPFGLAYDAVHDRLFVADEGVAYNRILVFDTSVLASGMGAAAVLGAPDFTAQKGGPEPPTAANFVGVQGVAYDAAANYLYVADGAANRVLVFDAGAIANGMGAAFVLGQNDFNAMGEASGAAGLRDPRGVTVDESGRRLFIADSGNNRVVVHDIAALANDQAASAVIGQADFDGTGAGLDAARLNGPADLAFDAVASRLFVLDNGNNRVVMHDAGAISNGQPAAGVLGQPDTTSASPGTSATSIGPGNGRLGYDAGTRFLYVGDGNNNRVVVFDTSAVDAGEAAFDVFGQSDEGGASHFLTKYPNNLHPLPNSLGGPEHVAFDTAGHRLFVADRANARVLVYQLDATNQPLSDTAVAVIGQVSLSYSLPAAGERGLADPSALAYDAVRKRLFVADASNNRVLVFDASDTSTYPAAGYVLGQDDFTVTSSGVASNRLSRPGGLALDGDRLFVADTGNNRVLVFDAGAPANGMGASVVLGAAGFDSPGAGAAGPAGLQGPRHLAADGERQRLYVADTGNNRVVVFEYGQLENGQEAAVAIGQPDLEASAASPSAPDTLGAPAGLSYDSFANRLFVADSGRHRVLIFNVSELATGMAASAVIGQADFVAGGAGTSSAALDGPQGLAYDAEAGRLFLADTGNNRVLTYDGLTPSNTPAKPVTRSQADMATAHDATSASDPDAKANIFSGQTAVLFTPETGTTRRNQSLQLSEELPEVQQELTTSGRIYWRLLWWLPIILPLIWAYVLYRRRHHHLVEPPRQ